MNAKLIAVFLFAITGSFAVAQSGYLPLPDGSSLKLRAGETPEQGWTRAQQMYPQAFVKRTIPDEKKYDVEYLNKCELEATRNSKTELALTIAVDLCRKAATPKKCRSYEIQIDAQGNESGEARIKCVEKCRSANYFSRTFGECTPG